MIRPASHPVLRRAVRALGRLVRARSGAAAVEFALVGPVFVVLVAGMLDLGYAFYVRLRVANATTAAALYAQLNGTALAADGVADFIETVRSVAVDTAALPRAPTVTVLFNNAPDGGSFGASYCLTGFPATWLPVGASVLSCGGSLTPGKFVSVTVSADRPTLFVRADRLGPLSQTSDRAVVRVQ